MTHALRLATWVRARVAVPVTHLKLQKLCFYCYGGALAFNRDFEVAPQLPFEAWEHGPVNREIWLQYREHGSAPIAPPTFVAEQYSAETQEVLEAVITVYGRLSAWHLRQESHLERPWRDAWRSRCGTIPNSALREHFAKKFRTGPVSFPEHLLYSGSLAVDGIPAYEYKSLKAMAQALEHMR
jgi:uncharacterized phage-associated protein